MICYIVDSIFFRDFVKHLLAIKLNRHRHQTHITKANLLLPLVNKLPPLEVVVSFETKLSLMLCPHHYHLKDTSLCRNDLVP
jgi:hypothetical protein